MLRPIPGILLKDKMQLKVCMGLDAWQKASWETYEVNGVHLQTTNEVKKTKDNTEVVLRSVLFIDGTVSLPQLDYEALIAQSEKAGRPMRCEVYNAAGQKCGSYEVITVDIVPDVPATRTHHVELGLV
jgi:hypothetical protein